MLPGVVLAGYAFEGIEFDDFWVLLVVAAVLTLLNILVRPFLILFALPFVVLTMGLGIFLINALLLYFAGQVVPGFEVDSYGTALLGSLLASVVNFMLQLICVGKISGQFTVRTHRSGPPPPASPGARPARPRRESLGDDVIDV